MASYRTHSLKDFIQILFNSQGGSEETDIWIYGVLKLKTYFCRPVYVDNYIPSFLSRCESNQSFFFFYILIFSILIPDHILSKTQHEYFMRSLNYF